LSKVAVVTGCSAGIGRETALCFARKGYQTIASVRNLTARAGGLMLDAEREGLELEVKKLDVSDNTNVREFFKHIRETKNRIDVLVNNAGYGLFGALEDYTMNQIQKQFDTNFFGIVDVIQNALPIMREGTDGDSKKIINVSSLNGLKGYPLFSAYNSSKFALEGLSETLRIELRNSSNIYSVLVEFGAAKTEFPYHLEFGYRTKSPDSYFYEESKLRHNDLINKTQKGLLPTLIATSIVEISSLAKPRERYLIDKSGIARPILKKYLLIHEANAEKNAL